MYGYYGLILLLIGALLLFAALKEQNWLYEDETNAKRNPISRMTRRLGVIYTKIYFIGFSISLFMAAFYLLTGFSNDIYIIVSLIIFLLGLLPTVLFTPMSFWLYFHNTRKITRSSEKKAAKEAEEVEEYLKNKKHYDDIAKNASPANKIATSILAIGMMVGFIALVIYMVTK